MIRVPESHAATVAPSPVVNVPPVSVSVEPPRASIALPWGLPTVQLVSCPVAAQNAAAETAAGSPVAQPAGEPSAEPQPEAATTPAEATPAGTTALSDVEGADPAFDAEAAAAAVRPDDVLTLIYTSGTTGPPKGVELTHANVMNVMDAFTQIVDFPPGARVISWLPAAHIAERNAHHYAPMVMGFQVTTLANPREIECSVLGNDEPLASVPGEIVPSNEFYDYAAKYLDGQSGLLIPAPLPAETAAQVRSLAVQAFLALDAAGMARVDFLLERDTGKLYLNEVNTLPGFTSISMYPKLWEAGGLSYAELVDRLIETGVCAARHAH